MAVKQGETSTLTALTLFTGLAIVTFGLFLKDANILFYAVPIIFALIVAMSRGNSSIDEGLRSMGITGTNIREAIPLGILSGVIVFFVGSFMIELSPKTASIFVPTFAIAGLATASAVIPSSVFMASNILMQWSVVAPAEEIGWRFLAPYIAYRIVQSAPIAFIFGIITWVFIHIPTYLLQEAPMTMYVVLVLLGAVSVGLIWITKGIIASWIAHSTFNTLVLTLSGGLDTYTMYLLIAVAIGLGILYYTQYSARKATTGYTL